MRLFFVLLVVFCLTGCSLSSYSLSSHRRMVDRFFKCHGVSVDLGCGYLRW